MASKGWGEQSRQERFDNEVESQGVPYSKTHSFHSANLILTVIFGFIHNVRAARGGLLTKAIFC